MALPMLWQAVAGTSFSLTLGMVTALPTTPATKGLQVLKGGVQQGHQVEHDLAVGRGYRLAVAVEDRQQLGVGEVHGFFPESLELIGLQHRGYRVLHVAFRGICNRPGQEADPRGRAFSTVCWAFKLVKIWLLSVVAAAEVTAGSVPIGTTVF